MYYLLISDAFKGFIDHQKSGTTINHLYQNVFGNFSYCYPPDLSEQQAIANFLDQETARIDELIAKKQRLIELLQEKRMSLISQAVTKGLDPNASMKDSGIEWLGKVPSHWEIRKLGYMGKMYGGMTPNKNNEQYWDGDFPWISPKDMKKTYIEDSEDHLSALALKETNIQVYEPSMILIVVRGMILDHTFPVALTRVSTSYCQMLCMPCLGGCPGFLFSIDEFNACDDLCQLLIPPQPSPRVLCTAHQLERHGQGCRPRQAASRFGCA